MAGIGSLIPFSAVSLAAWHLVRARCARLFTPRLLDFVPGGGERRGEICAWGCLQGHILSYANMSVFDYRAEKALPRSPQYGEVSL
jgi:hypothetical protein